MSAEINIHETGHAKSGRTMLHRALALAAAAIAVIVCLPTIAQADYEQVGNFATGGIELPAGTGMAVNITGAGGVEPGSFYLSDGRQESRVMRYSPAGELEEIWGLKTLASGPDLPDEVNKVTVSATSGSYELTARTGLATGEFTEGSKVVKAVRTEVGAFHVGDPIETPGEVPTIGNATGDIDSGSTTVTSVTQVKEWVAGMAIYGPGIPAGTVVTAVSVEAQTLSLSQAATETKIGVVLQGRTTIAAVGAGTLELSIPATHSSPLTLTGIYESRIVARETTAPIPFNAGAAVLKAAFVGLPAFETADLSVSGDGGSIDPYQLAFEGAYAGSPVELVSTESTLAGGIPSSSVEITTVVAASTPGFQRCRLDVGDRCTSHSNLSTEAFGFRSPVGVAVDQTTGDVYVLNKNETERTHNLIEILSADGSQVITRFGDAAASANTSTNEEPEKIHNGESIAVDKNGNVYVGDGASRVMCFRPESPGEYHQYVYCGNSQDLKTEVPPDYISLDDAGHLYVASGEFIEERALDEPAAQPLCTAIPKGQLGAMTVDPQTGEVFYFNHSASSKKMYRLKSCDPGVGQFEPAQAPFSVSPAASQSPRSIYALVFNPLLSWAAGRPHGVLYAVDRERYEAGGVIHNGAGYVFAPAEIEVPAVRTESVSDIHTASAVLHAEINPNGFATHYVFQYLTEAQYEANAPSERFAGAREAPAGGGELGSGVVGQGAATIAGLSPDTAYRFRVLATSECDEETHEPCVVRGEPASFATYPLFPPGLPDHRAYELVSPVQKHGGEVIPAEPLLGSCEHECKPNPTGFAPYPVQSAPDGEALAYTGLPFTLFEGADEYDSYVARRTASGWQTTGLIPTEPYGVTPLAFDPTLESDLRASTISSRFELQSTSTPASATSLPAPTPVYRTISELKLSYAGQTGNFSDVFFSANDALTPESSFAPAPPDPGVTGSDLYESHGGVLSLVNALPGNTAVAVGARFASLSPDTNAVSKDGRRVYWEAGGHLYVREDGELTREVRHSGTFLAASTDGLRVLLSDGCLYSLATETCTVDLTQGQEGFQGIAGTDEDLSSIYFVDQAALADGAKAGTCETAATAHSSQGEKEEEEGKIPPGLGCNLYVYEAGTGTRFVTILPASDGAGRGTIGLDDDWAAAPGERTAEASRNGRFLAFASTARLTDYDNVGLCRTVGNFGEGFKRVLAPCVEAYLYDSATGRLVCASCDPTGEAPLGSATLRRFDERRAWFPQSRYLTDEGRLYFDSPDSLSSRDTNEGVEDVYEYEPQGAGRESTCQRTAGCVFLISSGTSTADSNLIAVDETGKNVFFDTRERLTLTDKDELLDIYDAREGGGISGETEVARAECQGESCQPVASAPSGPTPGSSSFDGAGNALVASSPVKAAAKAKPLTRTQRLAQALKSCRKDRSKSKQVSCEKQARKRFGAKPKTKVKRKGNK